MDVWLKSLEKNGQFVKLLSFVRWWWRLGPNIYSSFRTISLLTSTEISEFISSSFRIATFLFPQPVLYSQFNLLLLFMCLWPRQQSLLICLGVLLIWFWFVGLVWFWFCFCFLFSPSPVSGKWEKIWRRLETLLILSFGGDNWKTSDSKLFSHTSGWNAIRRLASFTERLIWLKRRETTREDGDGKNYRHSEEEKEKHPRKEWSWKTGGKS